MPLLPLAEVDNRSSTWHGDSNRAAHPALIADIEPNVASTRAVHANGLVSPSVATGCFYP